MHKKLEEKQQKDQDHVVKQMEEENTALKQIIADQKVMLEEIIKEKEVSAKQDSKDLGENIVQVEAVNKEQDVKIQKSDARIDNLKASIGSHSEILEAILKELKDKTEYKSLKEKYKEMMAKMYNNRKNTYTKPEDMDKL